MERNLLYHEITVLDGADPVAGSKDHFISAGQLPLAAVTLQQRLELERRLEQGGFGQASVYGGHSLKLNDSDKKGVYGGAPNQTKSNHVLQLQQDLREFGIHIRKAKPDGVFDFDTELSVREFQIYAGMPFVAVQIRQGPLQFYAELFDQHRNEAVYHGLVHGVADEETRRRILFWKAKGYKCPVIVETWKLKTVSGKKVRDKIRTGKDNLWHYRDCTETAPRMYVRDFSGYYPVPAGKVENGLVQLGYYAAYPGYGGLSSEKKSIGISWPETAITPDMFLGKAFTALSAAERSTFKAILAVSQVECEGRLDIMNAYDNAFISFGPFHWVLAIYANDSNNISKGEVAAYIAFLKVKDPAAYQQAFGFFGVLTDKAWNADGADFYEPGQRKYVKGNLRLHRGAGFYDMPLTKPDGLAFGNYFRSWHWFYRFMMAARTIPGFQRHLFEFAVFRLRKLMAVPVRNFSFRDAGNNPYEPTLSEIFTSEQAVAMTLRVHVRAPAFVTNIGVTNKASTYRNILRQALATMSNQGLAHRDRPDQWTNDHERVLIDTIYNYNYSINGLRTTVRTVRDYIGYEALSAARHSFILLT